MLLLSSIARPVLTDPFLSTVLLPVVPSEYAGCSIYLHASSQRIWLVRNIPSVGRKSDVLGIVLLQGQGRVRAA